MRRAQTLQCVWSTLQNPTLSDRKQGRQAEKITDGQHVIQAPCTSGTTLLPYNMYDWHTDDDDEERIEPAVLVISTTSKRSPPLFLTVTDTNNHLAQHLLHYLKQAEIS